MFFNWMPPRRKKLGIPNPTWKDGIINGEKGYDRQRLNELLIMEKENCIFELRISVDTKKKIIPTKINTNMQSCTLVQADEFSNGCMETTEQYIGAIKYVIPIYKIFCKIDRS